MHSIPPLQVQASGGNCSSRWQPVTTADRLANETQKNCSRWQLLADAAAGLRRLEEQRMQLVSLQVSMPAPQRAALQPVVAELTDTLAQQSTRLAALQADGMPGSRGSDPHHSYYPQNSAPEVAKTMPDDVKALVQKLQKEVARLSLAAIGIVGAVELAFKNDAALQDVEDFAAERRGLGTASQRASRLLSPGPSRSSRSVGVASEGVPSFGKGQQAGIMQAAPSPGLMHRAVQERACASAIEESCRGRALNGPARQCSLSPRTSPTVAMVSLCTSSPGRVQQSMSTLTNTLSPKSLGNVSPWEAQRSAAEVVGSPGVAASPFSTSRVMSAHEHQFGNLSANLSSWTVSTPRQLHSPRDTASLCVSEFGCESARNGASDIATSGKLSTPPLSLLSYQRRIGTPQVLDSCQGKQDNLGASLRFSPRTSMGTASDLGLSSLAPLSPSPCKMPSVSELAPSSVSAVSPLQSLASQVVPPSQINDSGNSACISSYHSIDTKTAVEPIKSLTPPDVIGTFNALMAERKQAVSKSAPPVGATGGSCSLPLARPLSNGPSRHGSPRGPLRPLLQVLPDTPASGSFCSNPPQRSSPIAYGTMSSIASTGVYPSSPHPREPSKGAQGQCTDGIVTRSVSLPADAQKVRKGPGRNSSPRLRTQLSNGLFPTLDGATPRDVQTVSDQQLKLDGPRNSKSPNVSLSSGRPPLRSDGQSTHAGRSISRSSSVHVGDGRSSLDGPSRCASPLHARKTWGDSPRKILEPVVLSETNFRTYLAQASGTIPPVSVSQGIFPPPLPMQSIPTQGQSLVGKLAAPALDFRPALPFRQDLGLTNSVCTSLASTQTLPPCPSSAVPCAFPVPAHSSNIQASIPTVGITGTIAGQRNAQLDASTTTLLNEGFARSVQCSPLPSQTKAMMLMATTTLIPQDTPPTGSFASMTQQLQETAKVSGILTQASLQPESLGDRFCGHSTTLTQQESARTLLSSSQTQSPQCLSPSSNSRFQHSRSSSSTTPSFSPANAMRSRSCSPAAVDVRDGLSKTPPIIPAIQLNRSARRSPSRSPRISPRDSSPIPQRSTVIAPCGARDLSVTIDGVYVADPKDWLDTLLSWSHKSLNPEIRQQLNIQRIDSGDYVIDDRRVSLRWGSLKGGAAADLLVQEKSADNDTEVPLHLYLAQAANVGASRSPRTPTGASRSSNSSQSQQTTSRDVPDSMRKLSMEIAACGRARLQSGLLSYEAAC